MLKQDKDMLDISDIQAFFGIGRSTAYRLIRSGDIPHIRIGRKIRVPRKYLAEQIEMACYNRSTATGESNRSNGGIYYDW